jgi:pimeloyl-ACP methyl ester carboxylesterase
MLGHEGRSVVLLHGWMTSGSVFAELLEVWRPEGVRLLVPDLRGAGSAELAPGGYALARYADDVIAVLDAEGADRAVLIGHSMGGQIAQLVAATRPDRVAGLCAVLPVPAAGLPLPAEASAMFRAAGGDAAALARILDMASPGLARGVRERLVAEALRVAPRCVAEAFDAWSTGGFADRLGAIAAPTLVVGSDDPFLPVALLREQVVCRIVGARLAKIDGAGHYAVSERPAVLAAILEGFLAGCGA